MSKYETYESKISNKKYPVLLTLITKSFFCHKLNVKIIHFWDIHKISHNFGVYYGSSEEIYENIVEKYKNQYDVKKKKGLIAFKKTVFPKEIYKKNIERECMFLYMGIEHIPNDMSDNTVNDMSDNMVNDVSM